MTPASDPARPLVVQSDRSLLVETAHPDYELVRDGLAGFAELETSPEHVHTYRLTAMSLWNAAAAGWTFEAIVAVLERFSKYALPANVVADIRDQVSRYGRVRLVRTAEGTLRLEADDEGLFAQLVANRSVGELVSPARTSRSCDVPWDDRGRLKQVLLDVGFPADDLAGYSDGSPLAFSLREQTVGGRPFALRGYQREAVDVFHAGGGPRGGSGVLVLPCGAGKTAIGIGVMARYQSHTLVLVTNVTAARQWRDELLDKTTLTAHQVGEYSGETKEVRPVTIATYQILLSRRGRASGSPPGEYPHFRLFDRGSWGLIVYDEVHLLPAPVFRITASLQARRRLGLTATLVREDGKEGDVFSLIGPRRYEAPWKRLEREGWIATGICHEIRIPLRGEARLRYAVADDKERHRIAATNDLKSHVTERLLERHRDGNVLVIGQYLDQLEEVARRLGAPLLTGQTPNAERARLYADFKTGRLRVLVVSKVANFSVDLPNADVAIQISGTFGSRQEEAQRLGRVLRPKDESNVAHFYALVSRDTSDQDFAMKRQRFLTEQGYRYTIEQWNPDEAPVG